jgi:hypothetical protein
MKKRFSLPLTAILLAFSVSACASTGSQSAVHAASNVPTALTSVSPTAAATSGPVADATLVTVPPAASTTTAAPATATTTVTRPAATTAAHPAVTTHTTTPASHPTTTRPAPKPTTAKPAATCEHHATIDAGTARCGAGESHPAGTTAECWDGTYSESASASGTCSHHKGVEVWYF